MALFGVLFAVLALVSWGFGDFFIQRATREIGIWRALFFIELAAVVLIFPFVIHEIGAALTDLRGLTFLTTSALALFAAALLIFKSFKDGKLSIVEPILTIELPIAVFLGITVWGEVLSLLQVMLVAVIFLGIVLAMTKHHTHLHYHKRIFEKGVWWAILGGAVMGGANFLFGASSQETSPLLTMWYTSLISAVLCFSYIVHKGEVKKFISDLKNHKGSILGQTVFDNVAWTAYAFSMTMIPISIATTISESYIAVSVVLGILVNHEKLERHQKIGIVLAILGVILLGVVTGK